MNTKIILEFIIVYTFFIITKTLAIFNQDFNSCLVLILIRKILYWKFEIYISLIYLYQFQRKKNIYLIIEIKLFNM